ncbi:unnamed protein product [Sympodiomycopsis kandeliae]
MSAIITNLAGKHVRRVVTQHATQYEPVDPLYIFYEDDQGRRKRTKRPPPPGLTKKEAQILRKIQRRAHYLDKGFYICGIRFGWTFLIGLIPGLGDLVDALLNYTLVLKPSKKELELPDWLIRQMYFNNAVSAGVGLIPLAGDIILAMWKANSRNAKLVEEFLRVKGEENMANGLQSLTPYTDERGRRVDHPAQNAAREVMRSESQQNGMQQPTTAQTQPTTTTSRKWWSKKDKSQQQV